MVYLAWRGGSARWNTLLGFVWGLVLHLPLLWWVSIPVGPVPWVALCTLMAAFQAATGAVWTWWQRWCPRRAARWVNPLALATLWVAAEHLRSTWPFGGFPWGRLAFSQTSSPLLPLAWVAGAPLVTGLVVLTGALAAEAGLALRHRARLAAAVAAAAAVLPVAAGLVVGAVALPSPTAAETGSLRVGAVQGNVPGQGLDAFGERWQVLTNHVDGTVALLDQVEPGELDLVLWPENGTDVDPQADPAAARLIDDAALAVGAPMLVGTMRYAEDGRYNTTVVWQPGVGVVDDYSKQHPAPFAEYIPLRSFVRPFSSAVDLVHSDMLPGTEPGVVHVATPRLGRDVGVGVVICFEVAYDDLVAGAVDAGGEVLVVQTNNANFGWTSESTQQLAMTRFRAVEHGRAAVQVSTVGVSGVITPDGTVVASTDLFTADQLVATLPLRTSTTPATRLGPWPARAASAVTLVALVVLAASAVGRRAKARRRRSDDVGAGEPVTPGRVLVVIPTYEESQTIATALAGLAEHVPGADVLVVDDGSPDGTADLVEQIAADEPAGRQVTVMRRTGKMGLGTAYLAGFAWALERGYDTVVEMDADGSHRAEDLPSLLATDADLVIGSRWTRGGQVVNWPKHREVLSRGANLYTRVMLGMGVKDSTAGFRAYSADLLRRLPLDEVVSAGYCFQIDMTWRAHQAGARIAEVPVVFVERTAGASKMSQGIITEALFSVARWTVAHRTRQIAGLFRHRRSQAPAGLVEEPVDS